MLILLIVQLFIILLAFTTLADAAQLELSSVSQLPVPAQEHDGAKANMIAIIGRNAMKNREGKSKDFFVTQKSIFTNSRLNYYLFPNWSKSEIATYEFWASQERADRILRLVEVIKKWNSRPTYLGGFSKGPLDSVSFIKIYPRKIKGSVLASGIYEDSSRKAKFYSMECLIGSEIDVVIIVAHHKNDACQVTPFSYANEFNANLHAP